MGKIQPLEDGRKSIQDQAALANIPVPVGATVKELQNRGFDTDPNWPPHGTLKEDPESPTGFSISWTVRVGDPETFIWALAT